MLTVVEVRLQALLSQKLKFVRVRGHLTSHLITALLFPWGLSPESPWSCEDVGNGRWLHLARTPRLLEQMVTSFLALMLAFTAIGKDTVLVQYLSSLALLFVQTSGIPFPKTRQTYQQELCVSSQPVE